MKFRFLVLCLVSLAINCISYTFSSECYGVNNPSDKKDCTSINSDSEPDSYCCLSEYKYKSKPSSGADQEGKMCTPITKTEYDNIKDYVKAAKESAKQLGNELSKYKIHCQSIFLKIGLVSLVTCLLF